MTKALSFLSVEPCKELCTKLFLNQLSVKLSLKLNKVTHVYEPPRHVISKQISQTHMFSFEKASTPSVCHV